jgi:hypothetical protein
MKTRVIGVADFIPTDENPSHQNGRSLTKSTDKKRFGSHKRYVFDPPPKYPGINSPILLKPLSKCFLNHASEYFKIFTKL